MVEANDRSNFFSPSLRDHELSLGHIPSIDKLDPNTFSNQYRRFKDLMHTIPNFDRYEGMSHI